MDYSITVNTEEKYILITVRGIMNRRIAAVITEEAHRLGKEHGINRYLEDVTGARNTDTITNNYQFAHVDMDKETIDRTARVAIVAAPDDHSHDFVETLARNAGLNVTLFRDREQAASFLRTANRIG